MFSFFKKKPLYIIHLSSDTGVPPIPVYDKRVTIGRGLNHVLTLPDNSISRNHLVVTFRNGEIMVMDLGTSNGSKLSGDVLPANVEVPYSKGQLLMLGKSTIEIKFEIYVDAKAK
ncbi:MAG: Inner rane component of cytoplasmic domain [Pseudomonadota bacterium]